MDSYDALSFKCTECCVIFDFLIKCAIRHSHNKNMGGGVSPGDRAR